MAAIGIIDKRGASKGVVVKISGGLVVLILGDGQLAIVEVVREVFNVLNSLCPVEVGCDRGWVRDPGEVGVRVGTGRVADVLTVGKCRVAVGV